MRTVLVGILACLLSHTAYAQPRNLSFDEFRRVNAVAPRPVFILLGASWCKYCAAMKNSVLRSREGIGNSYVLFLDGESRENIEFAGRVFRPKPSGTHEFARELGEIKGQLAYPTIVILNTKNEIIYQKAWFHSAKAIDRLLDEIESTK